jgi:PST family polysaccharide transporter
VHRPYLVKIVDNIGWLFFDKVLRIGVGLFVSVWVARYLGPEQFGLLSFGLAFSGLFGAFATLGLQSIVVRDLVLNPASRLETLGTAALLQLIAGLIAYLCLLGAIVWLRPEDSLARLLVAILGSMMLFKFSDVALYWFESQVSSKYVVWIQNACFAVFAVIKIVLIWANAPLTSFAWAAAVESLIIAVLILYMLGLRGPALLQLRFSIKRAKSLLIDCWPLLLSSAAIMIYMKIDQIMLGQMKGNDAVGIYTAAVRVSEAWYFIPLAIVASLFPALLEAKKRSKPEYEKRIQSIYDVMVVLSISVALPMTFLSTNIAIVLFGTAYESTGPVLAVHIWASVFVFLGVASSQILIAENKQIINLQRTLIGAAFNVGLNLILIPPFGPIGAAVATIFSYGIAAVLSDLIQKETRLMFVMKLYSMNPISTARRLQQNFSSILNRGNRSENV